MREAQTMRQQLHPNVLPLYTSFVHEQNLWMVMPYVSSGSVLNIMKYAHPEVRLQVSLPWAASWPLVALALPKPSPVVLGLQCVQEQ